MPIVSLQDNLHVNGKGCHIRKENVGRTLNRIAAGMEVCTKRERR